MAYATWNPSDKNASIVLADGDLSARCNTSGAHIGVRATLSITGKRYWEVTITTKGVSGAIYLGIAKSGMPLNIRVGFDTNGYGYASVTGGKVYNTSDDSYGATYTQTDVIGVAYDADTGKVWWAKNGTWQASGDPAAGTNAAFTGLSGTFYPAASLYYQDTKVTANFGESAFTYSAPSGFSGVTDAVEVNGDLTDTAGVSDAVGAYSLTDSIPDTAGVSDAVGAYSLTDSIPDTAGVSDAVSFVKEAERAVADTAGVADVVDFDMEFYGTSADTAGVADAVDGFNWTRFLSQNAELALRLFYCTLTGVEDGTTDVVLPISSFQARVRTGEPSYLSVVVPGVDYAAHITARPNGTLKISMAYVVGGVEYHREIIASGTLTRVRKDEGPKSSSMTLTAYKTETFTAKSVTLSGVTYKSTNDGKRTFRLAWPDMFLKPGDTAVYGADSVTVGMISFTISATGQNTEVQEA
jgi:hypothetical protein